MALSLQAKPSQAKPSQAKPSQNTPNYTFSFTVLVTHKTPFLARVLGKAFLFIEFIQVLLLKTIHKEGNLCMQIIASNSVSEFILMIYTLFFDIQHIGNVCHADINRLQGHGFNISPQKLHILYQTAPTHFLDITTYNKQGNLPADEYIKLVGVIIENRFIATGTILDIKRASKGIQKFSLQIKKIEPFKDYPSFGGNYVDKTVEIFSEIGIPSSFQVGVEASVLLRVSGDEWGQYLFLVEVIENEEKD